SVLDRVLVELIESREVTYSRPFAYQSFTKDTISVNGQLKRVAPRLLHGGAHLSDPEHQWASDLLARGASGLLRGALLAVAGAIALFAVLARSRKTRFGGT